MADGSDERKKERCQANAQKENQKKKNPREVFKQEGLPALGSAVVVSTTGGSLVSSLAGELPLAGDRSLAGERSLVGESPLGGVVEADCASGAASGCS